MPYTDTLGEAYYLYDKYVREMEKSGNKPVSFFKFIVGKR